MTAHIYNEKTHRGNEWGDEGKHLYYKRNTHGGKSDGKEKPFMAMRDDVFILIYMTLMKSWNPIQDGFVLIWNEHLGQREPDEIHMHWQTLMKEVYRDSIQEQMHYTYGQYTGMVYRDQGSCYTPMNLQYTGTVYRDRGILINSKKLNWLYSMGTVYGASTNDVMRYSPALNKIFICGL